MPSGVPWQDMGLGDGSIATNPMMFPDRVIEAHKVLTQ